MEIPGGGQGFAAGLPVLAAHFGLRLPEPAPERPAAGGSDERRQSGPGGGSFSGTGFCVHADGYVLTSHHVIEGAEEITIRTSEGRDLQADIMGSDEATDIAVLRVRGGGRFPYVTFDDASHVRVGD